MFEFPNPQFQIKVRKQGHYKQPLYVRITITMQIKYEIKHKRANKNISMGCKELWPTFHLQNDK